MPTSGTNGHQSMSSISSGPYDRTKNMRSPSTQSNDRVNALKRGSIRGVHGLLNNPYQSQFSALDGKLSPTSSYATSVHDVSGDVPFLAGS